MLKTVMKKYEAEFCNREKLSMVSCRQEEDQCQVLKNVRNI